MQIDTSANSFSRDQAIEILQSIYKIYFGRELDPAGEKTWTPIVEKYGFQGLEFVVHQIFQSTEMNESVQRELSKLYREHLGRDLDPVGRNAFDLPLRFFRERGREDVIESIRKSPEYAKRRIELRPDEEKIEAVLLKIKAGEISSETYAELAKLNAGIQRYELAIEAYNQALRLGESTIYYFERGNLYFKLGEYQRAMDDFEIALTKGYQSQGDAHFKIGQAFEMLGDLGHSLEEYKDAAGSSPQDLALVLYQLGIVQQKLGRVEEGIESFTKALDAKPAQELGVRILVERGRANVRLGLIEKAGSDFANFVGRSRSQKRLIQATAPTVYFVHNSIKQPIPDPQTLNYIALEHQLQILERVSAIELNAYPEGEPIISILSFRLVQRSRNTGDAAFLIDNGTRRWIPNPDTFITLGLDIAKIEILSQEEFAKIPVGLPIRNVLGKQPLKRSHSTGEYFIIEKGERRAVPNNQTLVAIGYSAEEAEELPEEVIKGIQETYSVPDLSGIGGS